VVADTRKALTLRESAYPFQYISREDVDVSQLERTHHVTCCPDKADCSYYSNKSPKNAVWTYDGPFPAVAQIEGHLAFYAERVDEKTEEW
jgi:uncharacterized protein (DUF427 family)